LELVKSGRKFSFRSANPATRTDFLMRWISLSYFYDRIAPLGLKSPFSITDLRHLAHDVCAGPDSSEWSRFKSNKEAHAELSDRPEYCLDLTFMYSLLSLGYELEDEREVFMGKKVGEVELGWYVSSLLSACFMPLTRPDVASCMIGHWGQLLQ
jgi:Golgi nucleoside diphosphatase